MPRGRSDVARGPAAPGAPAGFEASWKTAAGFSINGGGTWTSYTLDPSTGLLYLPGVCGVERVANDLGIAKSTLSRWRSEHEQADLL